MCMAKIISTINWKGGVGKTTLTYHIGTGLTHLDWEGGEIPRILLVDLDPQCSLSVSCLHESNFEELIFDTERPIKTINNVFHDFFMTDTPGINPYDYIIQSSVRKNITDRIINCYETVDLLPSHPDLIYTDMDISQLSRPSFQNSLLTRDVYKFKFLENFLNMVKEEYDYIWIDCPPNLNFITQNAIYASDYYIIPTSLDKLSTYGILSIYNKINDLNSTFGQLDPTYRNIELLGIISNNVVEKFGEPKASQNNRLAELKKSFPTQILSNYVTAGDGISSTSIESLPVYSSKSMNAQKQAMALLQITNSLVQLIP